VSTVFPPKTRASEDAVEPLKPWQKRPIYLTKTPIPTLVPVFSVTPSKICSTYK